ncbi:MAG: DUF192 domain-containing protein [Dehalococcoidia bacterium]
MRVVNVTKGTVVAESVREARTFWTRVVGLLGKRGLRPSEGLMLMPSASIHTLFMRFAIDVVFVDGENRVVRTVSALRPFRVAFGGRGARAVLELPVGSILASATGRDDLLRFGPAERSSGQ